MHKTFAPVDDVLIERLFQPAADLLAHRIGLSRAAAACFCIDLASFSWIASRAGALAAGNTSRAVLEFSLLLLGLAAMISLRMMFRWRGGKQGNPLRPAMLPHRAVVLLMLVVRLLQLHVLGPGEAADLAMLAFAASALYLGACREPPPVRRTWGAVVPAGYTGPR